MAELLPQLYDRASEVLTQLRRYYDSLTFSNFNKTNPHEYTILASALETLKVSVEEAGRALPEYKETAEYYVDYFSYYSKIAGQVKRIYQIYKENPLQEYGRERTFSQTAIQNIEKQRAITLAMTKEFRDHTRDILRKVQNQILAWMIEGKTNITFADITKRFKEEKWIVNLFTLCAQHFWSEETAKIVADMRYDRIRVEVPQKQQPQSQLTWQRLSVPLVPANLPSTLAECLALLDFKADIAEKPAETLKRFAEVVGCGVICMSVTTQSNMTYDVWSLTDQEYLRKRGLLEKGEFSGITSKKLERFKGDLTSVSPAAEDSFATHNIVADKYLILETHGDELYTILGDGSREGDGSKTSYLVSAKVGRDLIERLEKGITQDLEENEMYNKQIGDFIVAKIGDPFKYNEEEEEKLAGEFSSRVMNSFARIVDKYFRKKPEDGGPSNFGDVKDWTKGTLMRKFAKIFGNFMEIRTNLEQTELQLTFLHGLKRIRERMSGELMEALRDLEKDYNKLAPETRIEKFMAALQGSIKDIVGEKSNVFQALVKKKKILAKFIKK